VGMKKTNVYPPFVSGTVLQLQAAKVSGLNMLDSQILRLNGMNQTYSTLGGEYYRNFGKKYLQYLNYYLTRDRFKSGDRIHIRGIQVRNAIFIIINMYEENSSNSYL
jgi:hypothetical protein